MRPEEVKKSCWAVRVVVVALAARGTETESLDDMEPIYPFIERTNERAGNVGEQSFGDAGQDIYGRGISVTCDKLVHHFA